MRREHSRRLFLKIVSLAPFLRLPPGRTPQAGPASEVSYTDDIGTAADILAALYDGILTSGGVEYPA